MKEEKTTVTERENDKTVTEPIEKPEMKLDDARRVKAVSPGMLVAKRFFRNKLAMIGLITLVVLFLFCFLGSAIYPYSESQVFTTYKDIQFDYAFTKINEEFIVFPSENPQPGTTLKNMTDSNVKKMKTEGLDTYGVTDTSTGYSYVYDKLSDDVFTLSFDDEETAARLEKTFRAGTYRATKIDITITLNVADEELSDQLRQAWIDANKVVADVSVSKDGKTYTLKNNNVYCTYDGIVENVSLRKEGVSDEVVAAAFTHLSDDSFIFDGVEYEVSYYNDAQGEGYDITVYNRYVSLIASDYVFDRYDLKTQLSDNFRFTALAAIGNYDEGDITTHSFEADGVTYSVSESEYGVEISYENAQNEKVDFVAVSKYSVRRYSGEDSVSVATKRAMRAVMMNMVENEKSEDTVVISMEAIDENGEYILDEDGIIQFDDEEFYIRSENKGMGRQFVFRNVQSKHVADIYAEPSAEHILGLDSNAMDVFARIMYGGRISLIIGFIVVFIEILLGTIMGGISGYFGGIVDNIIMRIVDVFYCIPTMPILIILGAVFDEMKLPNLDRVIWMMAVLGFLGWPGIARLVRGQILSLREQEFMIAAEAGGLSVKRKIFKHLIPNVVPQLIVQATMGLGSVIITESTLSFLGLGVKFPMATWGQIINSVSTINDMVKYTYIWIPVGALICIAVIAFNFVGDGLRDAFDPKMSR